jgi:hypothetical protein
VLLSALAVHIVTANVAILSAQLRGRISRAQSAGVFDSLFKEGNAIGSGVSDQRQTASSSRTAVLEPSTLPLSRA